MVNQEYDRKISNLKRECRWGWEDNERNLKCEVIQMKN